MCSDGEGGMAKRQDSAAPAAQAGNRLRDLGGSSYSDLNTLLTNQAIGALWHQPGASEEEIQKKRWAGMAAMIEFKPTDAIEGMMAAQAVGLHSAAMECLRRAMIPEQSGEASGQLRRQGANLSRAFLDVVAALDRKRGKGVRQVVRVERVMVAPGGQAIVGNVQAGGTGKEQHGEGVGHDEGTGGEPHAPPARLAHDAAPGAVLPPLRSAHTGRDALPVACHAERALPDARGRLDGA